jgi:hypothetical protein
MTVLIEAISVVIRVDAVSELWPSGLDGFRTAVPNLTFCCDGQIIRVGFMSPVDAEGYVHRLERHGLRYGVAGEARDLVVVDQQRGPAMPCAWLTARRITIDREQRKWLTVAFLTGSLPEDVLAGRAPDSIETPEGWTYEGSLSETFGFVPSGLLDKSMRFLRHEDGLDVYLNLMTGREQFIGRTGQSPGKLR